MPASVNVSYPAEKVGLLLLDNPPKNFGTYELLEKAIEGLEDIRKAGASVVVVASDVPGYFMAHAWLPDVMAAFRGEPVSGDPISWRRLTNELERGPLISIAANNGQAWGGGAEISWACNLRIAARSATYGQPESILGLIPGGGGSVRLPRIGGQPKAMEMILGGKPISADEALAAGLVSRVAPDEKLREEAISWAAEFASRPAWALRAAKRAILQSWDLPMEDALRLEGYVFNSVMRPPTFKIMESVQKLYDEGADSHRALGL